MRRLPAHLLALALLPTCGGAAPPEGPPDAIVLVTLDTLRADHLPFHGYPSETAPFLSELARSSTVFTRAYSSSSHTAPSHGSMLTGLFPSQHGVRVNGSVLADGAFTMARLLAEQGYETAAFTGVGFLAGLHHGFQTFDCEFVSERAARLEDREPFRPAEDVVNRVTEFLTARDASRPLFLWVHLFDVHSWQHDLPEDEVRRARDTREATGLDRNRMERFLVDQHGMVPAAFEPRGDPVELVDRYDSQIAVVDGAVARLFDVLPAAVPGPDTAWMITSDHGEGLGSHGFLTHGKYIYEEQIHVPLLLHLPERSRARRTCDEVVRHVDLLPSVAELVGTPLGERLPAMAHPLLEGRSLLPAIHGVALEGEPRLALAERRPPGKVQLTHGGWDPGEVRSLQTERFKLILHENAEDEHFDLARDPLERAGDSAGETVWSDLVSILGEHDDLARSRVQEQGPTTVDETFLEELRQLGYVR